VVSDDPIEDRDLANQHFDRGLSFDIRGKLNEAIEEMEKAISFCPNFAEAYNKLGDFYQKKGWLTKAIEMYKKSIELDPKIENSHFDLGCAYARTGKYLEALAELDKALSIDPNHFEIFSQKGFVFLEMGLYSEAIESLRKAILKDPMDIMACFVLGIAFLKVNKQPDAFRQFEKVIEHFSNLAQVKQRFAEANFFIGKSYYFMQDYEKAVTFLKKAIEFDTEEVDHHFSFGLFYSDGDAFFALSEAYFAQGDKKSAREALEKALNLEPNNQKFLEFQKVIY